MSRTQTAAPPTPRATIATSRAERRAIFLPTDPPGRRRLCLARCDMPETENGNEGPTLADHFRRWGGPRLLYVLPAGIGPAAGFSSAFGLAADGPVTGAVTLLQLHGDDRLRLIRVANRIAAGRLGRGAPGRLHELEGAAVPAAAADRVRVAARLALTGPAGPTPLLTRGVVPEPLVLGARVAAAVRRAGAVAAAAAADGGAAAGAEGVPLVATRASARAAIKAVATRTNLMPEAFVRVLEKFTSTPLFRVAPTGLADGFAPKSRRYATVVAIHPNMWVPRPPRLSTGDSAGITVAAG